MRKFITSFLTILIIVGVIVGVLSASGLLNKLTSNDEPVLPSLDFTKEDLPDIDITSWEYTLTNYQNPLPRVYTPILDLTEDGYYFDSRAVDALDALLAAGREAGMQLALTSTFRTYDYQDCLYQDKIDRVMAENGVSKKEAEEIAATVVAVPGTSEHNLVLAADIVSQTYNIMDDGYADTPEAQWLRAHCSEYGFILRYDEGKQPITKIIYEPWHFRYVGVEAAKYIMESDLCLEEFLALYYS